jgi:hypothetical protein
VATKKKKTWGNYKKTPLVQPSRKPASPAPSAPKKTYYAPGGAPGSSGSQAPAFDYKLGPSQQPVSQSTHAQQPTSQLQKDWARKAGQPGWETGQAAPLEAEDIMMFTGAGISKKTLQKGAFGMSEAALQSLGLKSGGKIAGNIGMKAVNAAKEAARLKGLQGLEKVVTKYSQKGAAIIANPASYMPDAASLARLSAKTTATAQKKTVINTKNIKLSIKALTKFTSKSKYSMIAIGSITSTLGAITFSKMMAENELNDGKTNLMIGVNGADDETLAEIKQMVIEIDQARSWSDKHLPVFNYLNSAKIKGQSVFDALDVMAEVNKQEAANEKDYIAETKERIKLEAAEFDRQREEIEASKTRERLWQDMNRQERERADEEMQTFWQNYLNQKQAGDEEMRKFWEEYQANKQKFWEEYQKNKGAGGLGFGLL